MKKNIFTLCMILTFSGILVSLTAQDVSLPEPDKTGGMPLMQALNKRETTRSFTKEALTNQQLSNLLWAGWGINREDINKRTAPSAMNYQEIDLYVTLPSGLYIYDAGSNILRQINNKDFRRYTGTQFFVNDAALNIVYVADMGKAGKREGSEIKDSDMFMSYSNAAFIAQNIYLYCASANLGCVIRGSIPKDRLASEMGLRSNQKITLAQTVGIPKKD